MDSPLQKWLFSVLKRSWCVMQECGLEPLQFNWFRAAMRLYNSLTKSNSYTMKKVLHVDMQLSTSSDRRQNCEPIDLSRFVVDLRERDLEYRTSYSETHPREHNSKRSTYHQWCALLTKKALVTHLPNILPKYMLNYLPRDVIRSTARFRLRVHTLHFKTASWRQSKSPTCDLCDADDDVQDEQHVLFH